MVTEQVRTLIIPRAATALDQFLRTRKIGNRSAALWFGVEHPTAISWRRGEKTPTDYHRAVIEARCAKLDANGNPILRTDGRLDSEVPREWWDPVQPAPLSGVE